MCSVSQESLYRFYFEIRNVILRQPIHAYHVCSLSSEVVYIGTIHSNHAELSKKMLAAGKHVLCEKPMAINWKQGKQVIDMARKSNLFFAEVSKEQNIYCPL